MPDIASIVETIASRAGDARRFMVAVAGPPASGKSTLAEKLHDAMPAGQSAVVPMDGYHFDDRVLDARGLRARKGAPETFDYNGFAAILTRIRAGEPDVAIPVFDRSMELSRAGAAIVAADVKFILVEGNYLLLDEAPWNGLGRLFDLTIYVEVPRDALERRLRERWRHHGKGDDEARAWIASNDMPNIDRVLNARRKADMVV